ncbi:hypothetical protein DICVIV_04556 [Dictyocaulus viviparus]|uniref:Zinc-hook domain-containing protein n=1 Tax=Dictyocaulus viviparus TaxID=29172 RepID=A0A0D8XZJ4_DICVI|nr:hypothetical protein DICVIV_04556 [Dictyocaulus viviparus]
MSEVEQLKEKISSLCNCSPHDVADNLSETRHLLSKSRKELASMSTKALLYESWSEETTKRSCCPLCERRFSSKGAAAELSGKLLDMSLSLPQDIERLEKSVREMEEKERHLASALVLVDQCKKIMEEKVKFVRKQMSDYLKEEAKLSEKVEELKDIYNKEVSTFKLLLDIKADVSLMDSLFLSIRALDNELNEISGHLGTPSHISQLSELIRDIDKNEKELAMVNAEMDQIQSTLTERNKLMAEVVILTFIFFVMVFYCFFFDQFDLYLQLHIFKERRISLGEFAGHTAHIQAMINTYRSNIIKLNKRHQEIVERELPFAKHRLSEAKNARDIAERFVKEQEDLKLCEIREMRNRLSGYTNLVDKLGKMALASGGETMDSLTRRIAERDALIIDLERRKAGFEIGINDLEGNHSKRRILEDQLTRMLVESKVRKIEQELAEIGWNKNDKETYHKQRENALKERDECNLEKARLMGQLQEVEKKIAEASSALSSKEMKQAEGLYHDVIVDKIITQEMITVTDFFKNFCSWNSSHIHCSSYWFLFFQDLEKYMQCLDTSIIQFHTDKMIAINRILDDLWRKVYDGNDIQSISIKSECAATSEKRKVYDYRVVMVLRNGVELDMRDRCSAGQKMLACILIRLALADVFGGMCSIMALDEPTTNLDSFKVDHIAAMLNSLIAIRRRGYTTAGGRRKQFQAFGGNKWNDVGYVILSVANQRLLPDPFFVMVSNDFVD